MITPDQDLDAGEVGFILTAQGVPLGSNAISANVANYVVRWGIDLTSPLTGVPDVATGTPVASMIGTLEIHVNADTAVPRGAFALLLYARSSHGLEKFAASALLRDAIPKGQANSKWSVEAGGEVRLLLRHDNTATGKSGVSLASIAAGVEQTFDSCKAAGGSQAHCSRSRARTMNKNTTSWCPDSRAPKKGLRMIPAHARRMQEEVGKKYGDLLSTKEALVVIHVQPTPGIPGSTWIYATRPVYLSVDPSLLYFLSAGMLLPNVKTYQIGLMDTACDLNFTNVVQHEMPNGKLRPEYADEAKRAEEIY